MIPNYREMEAVRQRNDYLEWGLRDAHERLLRAGVPGCPPRFSHMLQWQQETSLSGGFGKPPSAGVRMPRNKKYRLSPF